MKLGRLLADELARIFWQKGTYVGYGALVVLVSLMTLAIWRFGSPFHERLEAGSDFLIAGKLISGVTVARLLMEPALLVLVPLLVAAISGGVFAAEMQRGTMRVLLCRPVRRWQVATAKYLAGWTHAISLTLFLGLSGLLIGWAVFGRGELIAFRGGLTILTEQMALLRLGQAYLVAALGMCAVASVALLCSQLVHSPLTATAATVAFLLIGGVLAAMPYFEWLSPYLLSTHLEAFSQLFSSQVEIAPLRWPLACMGLYVVVPFIIGQIVFRYQDITC